VLHFEVEFSLPFYQGKKDFGELYPIPNVWCTKLSAKIAEINDILISVRAPVGPVNICREKSIIGRGLAALRVMPTVLESKFLFYFLKSIKNDWVTTGSTFGSITRTDLENLEIPLPPLTEQKRIVKYLDGLSEKVRALRDLQSQTAAEFEDLKSSILHVAFNGELLKYSATPPLLAFARKQRGRRRIKKEATHAQNFDGREPRKGDV